MCRLSRDLWPEVTPENVLDGLTNLNAASLTIGVRHGSQDPGVEGSGYKRVSILDNSNGGYT